MNTEHIGSLEAGLSWCFIITVSHHPEAFILKTWSLLRSSLVRLGLNRFSTSRFPGIFHTFPQHLLPDCDTINEFTLEQATHDRFQFVRWYPFLQLFHHSYPY